MSNNIMIWTHFFGSSSRGETDCKSPSIHKNIVTDIIFYVVWDVPNFTTVAHYLLSLLMRELCLLRCRSQIQPHDLFWLMKYVWIGHIPFSTRRLKSNYVGSFVIFLFSFSIRPVWPSRGWDLGIQNKEFVEQNLS